MHELSITQRILDISLQHAQAAQARHITDIYIVIGQLSSFVDDAIQAYWDIISGGTLAEGARLHFTRIPAEIKCHDCAECYPLDGHDFACPFCGSTRGEVISGSELYVESIDVT